MKKRKDGRYVKKVKLQDGTFKYLYSSAKNEREATKDFNAQLQQIETKQEDKRKSVELLNKLKIEEKKIKFFMKRINKNTLVMCKNEDQLSRYECL